MLVQLVRINTVGYTSRLQYPLPRLPVVTVYFSLVFCVHIVGKEYCSLLVYVDPNDPCKAGMGRQLCHPSQTCPSPCLAGAGSRTVASTGSFVT